MRAVMLSVRGPRLQGTLMAAGSGVLWGLSGTAAQVLFERHGLTPQWLVSVRMLGSAAILLVILRPALPRRDLGRLVVLGVLGLALVQYTYFAAIALMGVALATFVQYLSLPMIALWEGLVGAERLRPLTWLAVALAMAGTAALLLGSPHQGHGLGVSAAGLAVGLLSALTAAFYTLYSVGIVRDVGAWRGSAYGFLFGGLVMSVVAAPWSAHPTGDLRTVALLTAFVVVLGTLVPFSLYLSSLRRIRATEAGTAVTVEPVSAAIASALLLGAALAPVQYAGGTAIIAAVLLVRYAGGRAAPALPEATPGEEAERG